MASVPTSGSAPPPPVWDATPRQAGVVRYADSGCAWWHGLST